jgi:hypothetical protein
VDFRTAVFDRPLGMLNVAYAPYEESYRNELDALAAAVSHGSPPNINA